MLTRLGVKNGGPPIPYQKPRRGPGGTPKPRKNNVKPGVLRCPVLLRVLASRSASWPSRGTQKAAGSAPGGPKNTPGGPQEPPQSRQEHPRTAQKHQHGTCLLLHGPSVPNMGRSRAVLAPLDGFCRPQNLAKNNVKTVCFTMFRAPSRFGVQKRLLALQEYPKGRRERPRRAQKHPRRAPGAATKPPGAPQDGPKAHPKGPKSRQGAAKCAQEPPRRPQEAPNRAPRGLQEQPRGPQEAPRSRSGGPLQGKVPQTT